MAGDSYFYDAATEALQRGRLDLTGSIVKVMLVTDDYKPSQAEHSTRAAVIEHEVPASGSYRTGGAAIQVAVAADDEGNWIAHSSGASWTDFEGSFRYAVVYLNAASPRQQRLVAYSDLGFQDVTGMRIKVLDGVFASCRSLVLAAEDRALTDDELLDGLL